MKFSGKIENGTRNKPLSCGSDPWPWRRFALNLLASLTLWPWRRFVLSEYF